MSDIFYDVLEKNASVRKMKALRDYAAHGDDYLANKKNVGRLTRMFGGKKPSVEEARRMYDGMVFQTMRADSFNKHRVNAAMRGRDDKKFMKAMRLSGRIMDKHGSQAWSGTKQVLRPKTQQNPNVHPKHEP